MRKKLSLIALLLLAAAMVNSAYAHKSRKAAKSHKPAKFHKTNKSPKSSKAKHHEVAYEEPRTVHYDNSSVADSVSADNLVNFAQTLIGTRYRSAMSDPDRGFDCSGFVSYVFKYFNFKVPRSSPEFIDVGEKVTYDEAKPGDIVIFTSPTNSHRIGHVGIVYSNTGGEFKFIHSTSGKEHGVTITKMDDTYKMRFVQVVRLIKSNDAVLAAQ